MATTLEERPDLRLQKHETEMAARRWIDSKGGAFISINWKKLKIHYLNSSGAKAFITISRSPR